MFSLEGFQPNASYWLWVCLSLLMAYRARRTYGGLAGLTLAWMSFSALRVFAAPVSPYAHEEEIWNASLSLASASALIGVILACSCIQMFTVRAWLFIWNCVALINAFAIIIGAFFGQNCGILANASMSGCLNAVLFPLFFQNKKVPVLTAILIPLSVLVTMRNQPIALMFLSVVVVLIQKRFWKEIAITAALFVATGFVLIGRDTFGNLDGRSYVWKLAFDFFRDHGNAFTGMGLGTFYFIGPWLTLKPLGQGYVWLHSDWFQVAFETGLIGLGLVAALFFQAVYEARKNVVLCTSLLCYGAFALANFPLHNPISACLGAFLLHWTLAKAPEGTRTPHQNYPA